MPSAVVIGILSVVTGALSDLIAPKVLIIFGLATSTLCMFQHATITTVTSIEAITSGLPCAASPVPSPLPR